MLSGGAKVHSGNQILRSGYAKQQTARDTQYCEIHRCHVYVCALVNSSQTEETEQAEARIHCGAEPTAATSPGWTYAYCVVESVYRKAMGFESRPLQDSSPLHVVHTGSGAHPTSYPIGNEGSFPGASS
jgi:hypothetical protein